MAVGSIDLSYAEKLILHRRRNSLTQSDMADSLYLNLRTYQLLENGWYVGREPMVEVDVVQVYEECFIRRIRARISIARIAKEIGVCRHWVSRMERGNAPVTRLWKYWAKHVRS